MPCSHPHKPDRQNPAQASAPAPSTARYQRRNRLIACAYLLGLLLTFILSLLLLPTDSGLGKLLWSSLGTFPG